MEYNKKHTKGQFVWIYAQLLHRLSTYEEPLNLFWSLYWYAIMIHHYA